MFLTWKSTTTARLLAMAGILPLTRRGKQPLSICKGSVPVVGSGQLASPVTVELNASSMQQEAGTLAKSLKLLTPQHSRLVIIWSQRMVTLFAGPEQNF